MDHSLWGHLPLLVRSNSKDSVEYILQALWRTRKTGLDATDRNIITEMLQLQNENDLDPLLVCLRMLMRRCVYENIINKDEIQKLFPLEVLPELQRLLTILLQKFQREWRDDALKDQVTLPSLKTMTWNMANQSTESVDPVAANNLELQDDRFSIRRNRDEISTGKRHSSNNVEVNVLHKRQFPNMGETTNGHVQAQGARNV